MMENERKKILFLITKSNWGGAQRYVFDLATSLDSNLFEPIVALGGDGELKIKLETAGIQTITIPGLTRDISFIQELKATFTIAKILRREKPQVLHVNSSKAGGLGALIGRVLRVPKVVFTAHGWAFNEQRPSWQLFTIKGLHWATVLLSHQTIAVSTTTKLQMDWPWAQRKITVINPGRVVGDMKPKAQARGIIETKITDAAANLSDYHEDIWIGTIAELHPIKQLNRAIDSIASISHNFPTIRYIIIGEGQCEKQLKQQVRDLGIEKHVFFTGSIHEAANLLPAFDVFVLPSLSEAFGYVLLEAGLAQIPIVAANSGGVTDIITDNQTGLLIPPKDTPALTAALEKLLTDKTLSKRLIDAHTNQVKMCTIQQMAGKTSEVYLD